MSDLLDAKKIGEDVSSEPTLRPKHLDEYIGQEKMKENLRVFIKAALSREEPWSWQNDLGPCYRE